MVIVREGNQILCYALRFSAAKPRHHQAWRGGLPACHAAPREGGSSWTTWNYKGLPKQRLQESEIGSERSWHRTRGGFKVSAALSTVDVAGSQNWRFTVVMHNLDCTLKWTWDVWIWCGWIKNKNKLHFFKVKRNSTKNLPNLRNYYYLCLNFFFFLFFFFSVAAICHEI